ncbi:MAG: mucoidy inhibitor MuiA family protein [Pseudomonadota bacterium]
MTRMFLLALMASTCTGLASAASYEPDSRIDAVTVYPNGAQVTRVARIALDEGDHTIVIDDLPANIDPASIRVAGSSTGELAIGGVDVRVEVLESGGADAERTLLEARLNELDDVAGALQQEQADIQVRRDLLQTLVKETVVTGDEPTGISADGLAQTLSVVAAELSTLNKQAMDTHKLQRETQKQIGQVRAQLSLTAPKQEQKTIVAIDVSVGEQTVGDFDVHYNVREAGWRAIYDASLSLEDGIEDIALDIKRRALVQQATQESWDNVALTLSTARPSSATSAPELAANILTPRDLVQPYVSESRRERALNDSVQNEIQIAPTGNAAGGLLSMHEAAPAPQAAIERVATMETGGFNAQFQIAQRVDVANTREAKSVLLGVDEWSVDVSALSVPRVDPTAYLVAAFELGGELSYLPGDVLLNRDGTYIGRGRMPLLAPGETHQLGFGNDDLVVVDRVERDRKQGESGILVSSNTDTRLVEISVENNHTFAMPVRIIDRLPVSNHDDIEIEAFDGNTPATEIDVDGQRGVLAYDLDLPVGGQDMINVGYTVTWPGDMQITQVQ